MRLVRMVLVPCGTGALEPTKKDLMISTIISRAACLAEQTSNPKSFSNCPDLHGGVPGLISDVEDHLIPEASEIAQEVYGAATKHSELTQIVVNCEMSVAGGAVNKYGKTVEGPLKMGSITIDDLAEVRRYKDEDAYASQNQDWYAAQLVNMDYAYFLSK